MVTVQSGFRTSDLPDTRNSNSNSNQGPFDHWPNALTNCANRADNVNVGIKGCDIEYLMQSRNQ
jgi:hypothetical protein